MPPVDCLSFLWVFWVLSVVEVLFSFVVLVFVWCCFHSTFWVDRLKHSPGTGRTSAVGLWYPFSSVLGGIGERFAWHTEGRRCRWNIMVCFSA